MLSNSTNSNPELWKNYHYFEVEKYLSRMTQNPYFNELEEELIKEKTNKIKNFLRDDIYNLLDTIYINKIWKKCKNEFSLIKFCEYINEQVNIDTTNDIKKKKLQDLVNEDGNEIKNNNIVKLKPTELRISTMTACCKLGENITIDTKYLYKMFAIPQDIVINELPKGKKKRVYRHDLKELIIGCKAEDYPVKGFFEKDKKSNFFNSAALNLLIYDNKCINVKVFQNGILQMTGIPDEKYGKIAVQIVIDLLKSIPDDPIKGDKIVFNKKLLKMINYRTVLINSDYFCGMEIQRENLTSILQDKYELSVNYESENYPGVKLEFFWNRENTDKSTEGKCLCDKRCVGKGSGNGNRDCKKITISTFQSGKVIVTGGRNREQIDSAYKFINSVFQDNYEYLRKKTKPKIINNNKVGKYIFLKKNDISNLDNYKILLNYKID